MRRTARISLLLSLAACSSGPAADPFAATQGPSWTAIGLRPGLAQEQAWTETVSFLKARFELDTVSHETGTIRTAWTHDWTGQVDRGYRVRATVRFYQSDSKAVHLLAEAQRLKSGAWTPGVDSVFSEMMLHELGTVLGKKTG